MCVEALCAELFPLNRLLSILNFISSDVWIDSFQTWCNRWMGTLWIPNETPPACLRNCLSCFLQLKIFRLINFALCGLFKRKVSYLKIELLSATFFFPTTYLAIINLGVAESQKAVLKCSLNQSEEQEDRNWFPIMELWETNQTNFKFNKYTPSAIYNGVRF